MNSHRDGADLSAKKSREHSQQVDLHDECDPALAGEDSAMPITSPNQSGITGAADSLGGPGHTWRSTKGAKTTTSRRSPWYVRMGEPRTAMKGRRSSLRRAAAVFALSAALGVGFASSAAAAVPSFGSGCTASTPNPSGLVCLTTGASTRVARTAYANWENICGYRALLLIRYPDRHGDYLWSSTHSGCSTGYAWFDFNTNNNVPKGTRMCGTFFQNNQIGKSDGTACRYVS